MDPFFIMLFIILFLLSGFFSGTEIALMSLPRHKVDYLVRNKKIFSETLKYIKKNNDRLLITILIGNNLVNVYTAALATKIAIDFADSVSLPEAQAVGTATGIITFLLLLFGEIIPKSFATKNATRISLLVSPTYKFLMIILFPIIIFIEIIIKVFSGKNKIETMTGEEIESFIDLGMENGGIDKKEHEKIKSVLELDDTTVDEIMTPRVKIEAISINSTIKDAISFYLKHTHSRIPVFNKTIDSIDYFLTPRDLTTELNLGNHDKKLIDINLRKVLKVPINQSVSKLFDVLKKSRKVLAMVIDEYGGVAGLVTTEDIVEEVFGEIRDETDKETDEFIKNGDNSFVVESDSLIEDLLEKFNLYLDDIGFDKKEFDGQTISYVITNVLGDFPLNDQVINFKILNNTKGEYNKNNILQFKVLEIENAKIGKIEVKVV